MRVFLKFVLLTATVVKIESGYVDQVAQRVEEYDPNPQYSFGYDVQDALTGDSKNHVETRNGDVVRGSYSLNDPDGTRRIVEYTADPINGFNAIVRKVPLVPAAPVSSPIPATPGIVAPVVPPTIVDARAISYTSPPFAQIAAPPLIFAPFNYGYQAPYY